MAVVLRLKHVYDFNEAHRNAKDAYGDVRESPIGHFNVLFRCLFGLGALPGGTNPHNVVDMLNAFLRWITKDILWFVHRVKKYLWALKRRRAFLRQCIVDRQRRLKDALDRWQEHDADRELEARKSGELAARGRGRTREAPPQHTSRKKLQVIAYLHQHRLQHATADARDWVRHCAELKSELRLLSRRLVELWMLGASDARETSNVVVRVSGVRSQLLAYRASRPIVPSLKWDLVTVEDLEQLEFFLTRADDEHPLEV